MESDRMLSLSEQIENIILQHGNRGMHRVQSSMESGYCRRAAQLLLDNKGVILIGTGFPVSGSFESDGPIGAIALYRVLLYLDCHPVLVCGPPISKIMARGFLTYELPLAGWEQSRRVARHLLDELNPSLIVSVERPGMTADGRYYNMHGQDISASTAKFDLFLQYSDCPSIAFGDGGNEIGMGNVRDALARLDVIPSVTTCDELVIATVSNWGVYGVIAILCHQLKQDLFALIDPAAIAGYLVANGCVDGITTRPEPTEDSFPISVGISIIQQLRQLVLPAK
ncbi:MAG: DUF4392 domain-containing protein [Desulfobacterales bacterium]|nr:MAG: DUF4392 domain-containing protein [Desulfobacterales bacterium]